MMATDAQQQALIERIDERTASMEAKLDKVFEVVFIGNGHPSVITRMTILEQQFGAYLVQCAECKRTIVAQNQQMVDDRNRADNSILSQGKDIMIERERDAKLPEVELAEAVIAQQTEIKKAWLTERQKTIAAVIAFFTVIGLEVIHILSGTPVK